MLVSRHRRERRDDSPGLPRALVQRLTNLLQSSMQEIMGALLTVRQRTPGIHVGQARERPRMPLAGCATVAARRCLTRSGTSR